MLPLKSDFRHHHSLFFENATVEYRKTLRFTSLEANKWANHGKKVQIYLILYFDVVKFKSEWILVYLD
jgi:hypothetical protein